MRARRLGQTIGLVLGCTIGASWPGGLAHANGRFPQAQAIESVPGGDGSTLFLRATFGILVSRDAGKSWRWICERALGYEGTWDPSIAVTRDGRLWVGLEGGLVSTTDGCEVDRATELEGETVKDLTTDPKGETLWAITGTPGKKSWIWRKPPRGKFERLGGFEDTNVMTIEVAPSNPSRLYVSGQPYGSIRGRLYRSDDGGRTLSGDKNDLAAEGPFFIAAIDPENPSRVLVRHLHTTGSDLLVTTDAGKSWKNVLSMKSAMFGFAKSDDGKTYWAGSGLPDHGIFRSTDRGLHWENTALHGVLCLHAVHASPQVLYVCENPFGLGAPAIGRSTDQGKTVEAIVRFSDIAGPVTCAGRQAADAGAAMCAASWPEAQAAFLPRPQARDVSDVTDAGTSVTSDAGGELAGPSKHPSKRTSSCSCDLVAPSRDGLDPRCIIAGAIALVTWARAHSGRGSRSSQDKSVWTWLRRFIRS